MREVILWTDGMNVLYWIRKQSWLFKCFVVNRVRITQTQTELSQWRYALTKCIPENRIIFGSVVQSFLELLKMNDKSVRHQQTKKKRVLVRNPEMIAIMLWWRLKSLKKLAIEDWHQKDQVVFAKFNLCILLSPTYERTFWFYEKANLELIRRPINEFDWIRALSNVSIDKKVCYFTETLLNIIHNFIPPEIIVWENRDLPWMNNKIKKLINEKNLAYKSKNLAYKSYCRFNRDVFLFEKFRFLQN